MHIKAKEVIQRFIFNIKLSLACFLMLRVEMCGNDFFNSIPSHSHDRTPIPIVVYKSIPIPSRNNIVIPIPSHSHSRTWYSKFLTYNKVTSHRIQYALP